MHESRCDYLVITDILVLKENAELSTYFTIAKVEKKFLHEIHS